MPIMRTLIPCILALAAAAGGTLLYRHAAAPAMRDAAVREEACRAAAQPGIFTNYEALRAGLIDRVTCERGVVQGKLFATGTATVLDSAIEMAAAAEHDPCAPLLEAAKETPEEARETHLHQMEVCYRAGEARIDQQAQRRILKDFENFLKAAPGGDG